ncbi:hypothetical protein RUM43_006467 [Polyplax serrata]|uniref:Uncharacterized protein n=1 Tax=Polyplax serrata TaxID=468196 RepID=A0AAN8PBI0_POLSC
MIDNENADVIKITNLKVKDFIETWKKVQEPQPTHCFRAHSSRLNNKEFGFSPPEGFAGGPIHSNSGIHPSERKGSKFQNII